MAKFPVKSFSITVAILCTVLLLASCGLPEEAAETVKENELTFSPSSVQISTEFSSIIAAPTQDSDTVSRLYELYCNAVLTEKAESVDSIWSLEVCFFDDSSNSFQSWTVCRDGSCSWGSEDEYYTLENGVKIYDKLKSIYDELSDVESFAQRLYELKSPYIGDASTNGAILQELAVEDLVGTYSIELKTDSEPYGLMLHLSEEHRELPTSDLDKLMGSFGYIYLSLVDNASYFTWDYNTASGLHRSGVYSSTHDIKQYSESYEKFYDLCKVVDSLAQSEVCPADVAISSSDVSSYVMYGAPADTVDKLWESAQSMMLEAITEQPENEAAINLMFYDSKGELIKVYSISSQHCRIDGGNQYYRINNGSMSVAKVKAIYDASQSSREYENGVYLQSEVFKDK